MKLLAFFPSDGDWIFIAITLAAFAAGFVLGLIRSAVLRLSLLITGPLVAWIIYRVVNPDPGCTYDCIGQLILGLLLVTATVAWWAGVVIATLCRWLRGRANPN